MGDDQTSVLNNRFSSLEQEAKRTRRQINKLRHIIMGNGEEGLTEVVRMHARTLARLEANGEATEQGIKDLQSSLNQLANDWREEKARDEGGSRMWKRLTGGLAILATIITIIGAAGAWSMNERVDIVLQQIRNIPTIPE